MRTIIVSFWSGLIRLWEMLLYRAWISTFALAMLVLLLCFSGQTRELLGGLNFALTPRHWIRWIGADSQTIGWTLYGAFWLSAVIVAAALSITTLLLGNLPLRRCQQRSRSEQAEPLVGLVAALIFVGSLALIHYAFMYAKVPSFFPKQAVPGAISLVIALGYGVFCLRSNDPHCETAALAFIVSAIATFVWMTMDERSRSEDDLVAALISMFTPLAAALLTIWARRHIPAHLYPSTKVTTCLLVGIISLMATARIALSYGLLQTAVWSVGSIPVVFLFFAWACVSVALLMVLTHRLTGVRGIDPVLAILLIAVLVLNTQEKYGREELELLAPSAATSGDWAVVDRPGVQLAIYADGGGLRAAMFTAQVLAMADDSTCGKFGEHVFAASGVSGGSLGIAIWAVLRQDYKQAQGDKAWSDCRPGKAFGSPTSDLVYGVLAQDHLSKVLAGLLTGDLFLPWGNAVRGQALLDSWQQSILDAFGYKEISGAVGLARRLSSVHAGNSDRPPYLLFSTTNVQTGQRTAWSNAPWWNARAGLDDIPAGIAVLNSARFPVISPAGVATKNGQEIHVVDGGYFDNSGAATLRAFLSNSPNVKKPAELKIVRLNGNTRPSDHRCAAWQQALRDKGYSRWFFYPPIRWEPESESLLARLFRWSGLRAYVRARDAHTDEAVEITPPERTYDLDYYRDFQMRCGRNLHTASASQKLFPPLRCVRRNEEICLTAQHAAETPLGWYLTLGAADQISNLAAEQAKELIGLIFP
ncbi:hypothetical protein [Bradyrhizobium diversitatis]|uniref:PNPLA domain-containing protein n=1 Tax=Bradyrhizobium diversitatis TaxID=2755406 RepID=A0ABS0PET7_9BRAD|nr:hypothetical protein [Bradyrhizobium diversitatis]MBH5391698.1 hypothetical protein [Bradyrhizobium diversitatis]